MNDKLPLTLVTLAAIVLLIRNVEGQKASQGSQRREEEISDFRSLGRQGRARFQCRKEKERCRHLPPCCENLTCFRPEGYSLRKGGVCVKCIGEGMKCQRDSQCCPDLQCNSGNALWIDGTCHRYRRSGSCYRDGQCVTKCVKEWYASTGRCT